MATLFHHFCPFSNSGPCPILSVYVSIDRYIAYRACKILTHLVELGGKYNKSSGPVSTFLRNMW